MARAKNTFSASGSQVGIKAVKELTALSQKDRRHKDANSWYEFPNAQLTQEDEKRFSAILDLPFYLYLIVGRPGDKIATHTKLFALVLGYLSVMEAGDKVKISYLDIAFVLSEKIDILEQPDGFISNSGEKYWMGSLNHVCFLFKKFLEKFIPVTEGKVIWEKEDTRSFTLHLMEKLKPLGNDTGKTLRAMVGQTYLQGVEW